MKMKLNLHCTDCWKTTNPPIVCDFANEHIFFPIMSGEYIMFMMIHTIQIYPCCFLYEVCCFLTIMHTIFLVICLLLNPISKLDPNFDKLFNCLLS